jgi:hypothetical protein
VIERFIPRNSSHWVSNVFVPKNFFELSQIITVFLQGISIVVTGPFHTGGNAFKNVGSSSTVVPVTLVLPDKESFETTTVSG